MQGRNPALLQPSDDFDSSTRSLLSLLHPSTPCHPSHLRAVPPPAVMLCRRRHRMLRAAPAPPSPHPENSSRCGSVAGRRHTKLAWVGEPVVASNLFFHFPPWFHGPDGKAMIDSSNIPRLQITQELAAARDSRVILVESCSAAGNPEAMPCHAPCGGHTGARGLGNLQPNGTTR